MSDTTKQIKGEYTSAKTGCLSNNVTTYVKHHHTPSVSTSRHEGKVKLRIAPREMPERPTTSTTSAAVYSYK